MDPKMSPGKSVSNMDFGPGKGKNQGATDKLMSTTAHEDPETVTGDNPQKAWQGKSGKPKGPFGPQGRDF